MPPTGVRTPLRNPPDRSKLGPMLPRTLPRLLVTLAIVPAAVAGCGDSQEDKATAQVCDARDDIAKQVKSLEGLTISTATTSQVADALGAIRDDLSKISDARADLSDERRKEVEQANDAFTSTLRDTAADVGRSISLEDAASTIEGAIQTLAASYRDTFGQIDCS